jgi:hypothetical protein
LHSPDAEETTRTRSRRSATRSTRSAAPDPFSSITGGDIEAAKQALEEARSLFAEVAEVAPEEIQSEVDEAQQFFDDFVAQAQDAESPEDLLSVATEFQADAEDFQETSGSTGTDEG